MIARSLAFSSSGPMIFRATEDYREVDGLLVPHRLVAHWKRQEEYVPYARFEVERIAYDEPLPD